MLAVDGPCQALELTRSQPGEHLYELTALSGDQQGLLDEAPRVGVLVGEVAETLAPSATVRAVNRPRSHWSGLITFSARVSLSWVWPRRAAMAAAVEADVEAMRLHCSAVALSGARPASNRHCSCLRCQ
ncbi:hypothetical protein Sgleb_13790 [Streptomyces glebosus]|uniref:Uncharacterized protein n=1 Tax=Streptomyces glebosus TaxID=249580 RepID=A0A640SR70_9ACTN|nr:hypothetical protein Sgleb_13790 [Streptomyces glebosus]GHG66408.1 hypothetical protein GCM10010513_35530 [Streptomyces glebosus]